MNVLDQIVKAKRIEVRAIKERMADLKARARDASPPRDFGAALLQKEIALIAEIKRASPAKGEIRPSLDPSKTAAAYEEAGAHAISCLTDWEFFRGSADDFLKARAASKRPMLRKDFTIHESQIWESRVLGADAILLIARILARSQLQDYSHLAAELGMASLFEVHDAKEMEAALSCRPSIVGINNRNLDTFEVSLETTLRLAAGVPRNVTIVAESGIRTREDVLLVKSGGARAILVGEEICRLRDPRPKIRELLGEAAAKL
jgi:indole-3-glycerol phosphate synthase